MKLIVDTFKSIGFLYTLVALATGFALFSVRFLFKPIPWLLKVMIAGLGFDALYHSLIKIVLFFCNLIRTVLENFILDGLNWVIYKASVIMSHFLKKTQTGSLHWNLLYAIIALTIILGLTL